uniref:Glucosylceramidase n=1 Tax=Globodera pallida TaxID=36090 RepID=A0A183BSX3_GLOPA
MNFCDAHNMAKLNGKKLINDVKMAFEKEGTKMVEEIRRAETTVKVSVDGVYGTLAEVLPKKLQKSPNLQTYVAVTNLLHAINRKMETGPAKDAIAKLLNRDTVARGVTATVMPSDLVESPGHAHQQFNQQVQHVRPAVLTRRRRRRSLHLTQRQLLNIFRATIAAILAMNLLRRRDAPLPPLLFNAGIDAPPAAPYNTQTAFTPPLADNSNSTSAEDYTSATGFMATLKAFFLYFFAICIPWQFCFFASDVTALPVDCAERWFPGAESFVCVCNSSYCDRPAADDDDDVQWHWHGGGGGDDGTTALVFMSDADKFRLHRQFVPILHGVEEEQQIGRREEKDIWLSIRVNASVQFQTVLGFGGAFTDSATYNLNSLSGPTRAALQRAYFDKNIVPMGATDFSVRDYSYCDTPDDLSLSTFALAKEDVEWKLPNIRSANALSGGGLRLFATPWSAPGWMKTNGQMVGAGTLKGALDGPYYKAFANYFKRFFEAYQSHGNVTFWGLTLTNEPLHGQRPGMSMNSTTQREWANKVLAPTLQQSPISKNIFGNWKNRSANAVAGLGVHWYSPPGYPYDVLSQVHALYPNKFLLATEACAGAMERAEHAGPSMGNWTRALQYGHDIIQDLRNWAVGWVDWNICLDTVGGPSWAQNFVDSPVIVNASADEFYKQPMFYAMAHFSRFINPNSVRIGADFVGNSSARHAQSNAVEFVAFRSPSDCCGGRRVLALISKVNRTTKVKVLEGKRKVIRLEIPPKGIVTVLWGK